MNATSILADFAWKNDSCSRARRCLPRSGSGAQIRTPHCFFVKTTSGADDRRYYGSVTFRIDPNCHQPARQDTFFGGIQPHRNLKYYGLRESKKARPASQFKVTEQSNPDFSLFMIDGGSENAQLEHTDFDLNQPDVQGEE
jgi:hypothetical protein